VLKKFSSQLQQSNIRRFCVAAASQYNIFVMITSCIKQDHYTELLLLSEAEAAIIQKTTCLLSLIYRKDYIYSYIYCMKFWKIMECQVNLTWDELLFRCTDIRVRLLALSSRMLLRRAAYIILQQPSL
jgi:hypothetical protein